MPKLPLRCPAATFSGATAVATVAVVAAVALLARPAAAQSTVIYNNASGNSAPVEGFTYDFTSSISGDNITSILADDITPIANFAGHSISSLTFVGDNQDGKNLAVRPIIYMWLADGTNGAPGTFLGSQTLAVVTLNGSTTNGTADTIGTPVTATFSSGVLTVPNSTFWLGVQYDNAFGNATSAGATATTADLMNTGLAVYDPVSVGSSADRIYETSAAGGQSGTSNPNGTIQNSTMPGPGGSFGTTMPANFGFAITASDALPEPGALSLFTFTTLPLLGAATIIRRRARRSA